MTTEPEDIRAELKRRAARLAAQPVQEKEKTRQVEVMPFQLASETYALEVRYIREVWPLTSVLPIPHTPPFVLGVTNVHSGICSVIDLKQFFSLPSSGLTNLNKLVILENEEMHFGILADEVYGSTHVDLDSLSSVADWNGIDNTYLSGITKDRMIVLDAKRILTDKRLIVDNTSES